jgi:hypothetical protein
MNERDFNCADAESDAPIIDFPRMFIQYIQSHSTSGGVLLNPQPEDAPWHEKTSNIWSDW